MGTFDSNSFNNSFSTRIVTVWYLGFSFPCVDYIIILVCWSENGAAGFLMLNGSRSSKGVTIIASHDYKIDQWCSSIHVISFLLLDFVKKDPFGKANTI